MQSPRGTTLFRLLLMSPSVSRIPEDVAHQPGSSYVQYMQYTTYIKQSVPIRRRKSTARRREGPRSTRGWAIMQAVWCVPPARHMMKHYMVLRYLNHPQRKKGESET